MQLWHWLLLLGLLFMITYNPRTGNLTKYFGSEVSVEGNASRETQSNRNSDEHSE